MTHFPGELCVQVNPRRYKNCYRSLNYHVWVALESKNVMPKWWWMLKWNTNTTKKRCSEWEEDLTITRHLEMIWKSGKNVLNDGWKRLTVNWFHIYPVSFHQALVSQEKLRNISATFDESMRFLIDRNSAHTDPKCKPIFCRKTILLMNGCQQLPIDQQVIQ